MLQTRIYLQTSVPTQPKKSLMLSTELTKYQSKEAPRESKALSEVLVPDEGEVFIPPHLRVLYVPAEQYFIEEGPPQGGLPLQKPCILKSAPLDSYKRSSSGVLARPLAWRLIGI